MFPSRPGTPGREIRSEVFHMVKEKKLLTIREAADYTGLPYCMIRRYVLDGSIDFVKSGTRYYLVKKSINKFFKIDDGE